MNAAVPATVLELQVEGLMQRVARYRDERCAQLRQQATAQAHEILRSGRAEARASVHEAVVRERTRLEVGARQAEARAELEARQRAQQEIHDLLGHLWTELPGLLAARWQNEAQRRSWIEAALAETGALLSGRHWKIERGSGWPESETRAVQTLALERGARSVEWAQDECLDTGLRVRAGSVVVDASISGLLARRSALESAFLAEYSRE